MSHTALSLLVLMLLRLDGSLLSLLRAICLMMARFYGAWSFRTRESSSLKETSKTQCRLSSSLQ